MKESFKYFDTSKINLETPKVLIVDDTEQNLTLLEGLLEDIDVVIVRASSGLEALEKVKEHEFAIALIDIQMPIIDGYKTLELIREIPKNKYLPVIFISAIYSDIYYKIKGVMSGAVDFITKPITPEILIGKVNIFLDLYKQQKMLDIYREQLEQIVADRTENLAVSNKQLQQEINQRIETEKMLVIAKEKAEESDRLKTAFLTNFSHEIRTPMNAIVGFSNLLNDFDLPVEQRGEYLEYINSNTTALLNLIESIIEISKIESGEIQISKSEYQINELLNELYVFNCNNPQLIEKCDVELSLAIDETIDNITMYSNQQRIREILSNLIDNAVKFTDKGKVEIGLQIEENNNQLPVKTEKIVKFFVKDTGIGIPKDKQNQIFDKFMKLETNNNKLYRGTGIGLAISKQLAILLGGNILVESEYGKGSAFYLLLPFETTVNN